MKKYCNLILMITLMFSSFSFVACSDDEEGEWKATYVYLERVDSEIIYKAFNFTHSAVGLIGDEVTTTFVARTQKPVTSDVKVQLNTMGNDIPAENITLTKQEVVIKAGEMKSEEVTANVDMTFAESIHDKKSYQFQLIIDQIQTGAKNTFLSESLNKLMFPINKTAYRNLELSTPPNSTLIDSKEARAAWTVTMESGLEGTPDKLIDGSTGTDVARNEKGFWIAVDLNEAKTVSGIRTRHWSSSFAPTEVEIFYSDDGSTWKSMSTIQTSGGTQTIRFISPVTTRYLKYQMLSIASGRVDMTEFYIYELNKP